MGTIVKLTNKSGKVTGYKAGCCVAGVRKDARFETRAEAKSWLAEIETELRKKTFRDTKTAQKMTFRELLETYSTNESTNRRTTFASDAEVTRIKATLRHDYDILKKSLSAITRADAKNWVTARRAVPSKNGGKISDSTIHRELDVFRSAMRYAKEDLSIFLLENPFSNVMKRVKDTDTTPRVWTDEERKILLEAFDQCENTDYKIAVLLLAQTGLRKAEITALRWCDYLHPKPLLHVQRVEDKSDAFGRRFTEKTKNDKTGMIPLTPVAVELLDSIRGRMQRHEELIFNFSYYALGSQWRRVAKWCEGRIEKFRLHDLRHVAITNAAWILGNNAFAVKEFARHSDIQTSLRYTHMNKLDIAEKFAEAAARKTED